MSPLLKKFLRIGLIGSGAATVMSGVVGFVTTWQLVDDSVERSIGIARSDFVVTYVALLVVGAAMVYLGLRMRK